VSNDLPATTNAASPLKVTVHPCGSYSIDGEQNVRAFAELCALHALMFEVRTGMKMNRGPSAYSRIRQRYGFKGNKRSVLMQYRADLESRGFILTPMRVEGGRA